MIHKNLSRKSTASYHQPQFCSPFCSLSSLSLTLFHSLSFCQCHYNVHMWLNVRLIQFCFYFTLSTITQLKENKMKALRKLGRCLLKSMDIHLSILVESKIRLGGRLAHIIRNGMSNCNKMNFMIIPRINWLSFFFVYLVF